MNVATARIKKDVAAPYNTLRFVAHSIYRLSVSQRKNRRGGGFFLLSSLFSRQATFPILSVSSLHLGLTSLFEMGRGVTPRPNQENKKLKIMLGRGGRNRTSELTLAQVIPCHLVTPPLTSLISLFCCYAVVDLEGFEPPTSCLISHLDSAHGGTDLRQTLEAYPGATEVGRYACARLLSDKCSAAELQAHCISTKNTQHEKERFMLCEQLSIT